MCPRNCETIIELGSCFYGSKSDDNNLMQVIANTTGAAVYGWPTEMGVGGVVNPTDPVIVKPRR